MSRLSRSKRGVAFNVVLVMLVTVVAGLALIIAGYMITKNSKSINDSKKCQMSFFAKAQMSKVYDKSLKTADIPVSIDCPRNKVEIKADKTVMKGGRIIDDLVKGKIAQEVMDCWVKTGSGKLDPSKGGGWIMSREDQVCLVCSEITFDKKFREKAEKQDYKVNNMLYWIATRIVPGQKVSLYEFVTGNKVVKPKDLVKLKEDDSKIQGSMDMERIYAVVWRGEVSKTSYLKSAVKSVVGLVGARILVALPGGWIVAGTLVATGKGTLVFGLGKLISGSSSTRIDLHVVPIDSLSTEKPPGSEKVYCSYFYN